MRLPNTGRTASGSYRSARLREDVTVSRDPVNNVVCAESDWLSLFTLIGAPGRSNECRTTK
jgi:hypothetical protein